MLEKDGKDQLHRSCEKLKSTKIDQSGGKEYPTHKEKKEG
jgi:hypothetical protein